MRSLFLSFLVLWMGGERTAPQPQVSTIKIVGSLLSSNGLPLRGKIFLVFDRGKAVRVGDAGVLSPTTLTNEKGEFEIEVDPMQYAAGEVLSLVYVDDEFGQQFTTPVNNKGAPVKFKFDTNVKRLDLGKLRFMRPLKRSQ